MVFLGGRLADEQSEIYMRDAQALASLCHSYTIKELGTLWASAALAKAHLLLDSKRDEYRTVLLALSLMDDGRRPSKAELGQLNAYLSRVIGLQGECSEAGTDVAKLAAAGFPIWITSLRAIINPVIEPQAKEIWAALELGDPTQAQKALDDAAFDIEQDGVGAVDDEPIGPTLKSLLSVTRYQVTPRVFADPMTAGANGDLR